MARMIVLIVVFAALFTIAAPVTSHAGFRSGFAGGFSHSTFRGPHMFSFGDGAFIVNRSFLGMPSFGFPARGVFVHPVTFAQPAVIPVQRFTVFPQPVVIPVQRFTVIPQSVFVIPVGNVLASGRCFFDQFGIARCIP